MSTIVPDTRASAPAAATAPANNNAEVYYGERNTGIRYWYHDNK